MLNIEEILFFVNGLLLLVKQLMIGPMAKQYGSFRLHSQAYMLKGGRLVNLPRYFVVVGDLDVPLFLILGAKSDDPHGYSAVVNERQGPFRDCAYVGDIPIKRSTYRDFYDHVNHWLNHRQMGIACYMEQLTAASDVSTGNPRRAAFYRKQLTKMEAEEQIVRDAFRAFLREYPDAAVGTKRNATRDEREARRIRKKLAKAIWLANKILK